MSRFFEELEAQLHGAARERAHSRVQAGPRGRRLGWLRTAVPVALALSTTAAVAALALVLLGHQARQAGRQAGGSPSPPQVILGGTPYAPLTVTPLQRQELGYIHGAERRVLNSAACRPPAVNRTPLLSQRTPSAQLLSILGVLRGPATPVQIDPDSMLPPDGETVYIRYVRLARTVGRVSFYLVPAGHWLPIRSNPKRCYAQQLKALHEALPEIPAGLRAGTLTLLVRQIAADRQADRSQATDGICLQAVTPRGASGSCLDSVADLAGWGTIGAGGTGTSDLLTGVVPDGVKSVTLRFKATKHWRALSVTGDVVGNVFVVRAARAAYGLFPTKILWRDAGGRVVKIVGLPWA